MYKDIRNINDYLRKISSKIHKAETGSKYYKVKCGDSTYKFRLSDHFGHEGCADVDIVLDGNWFILRIFRTPIVVTKQEVVPYIKSIIMLLPTIENITKTLLDINKQKCKTIEDLNKELTKIKNQNKTIDIEKIQARKAFLETENIELRSKYKKMQSKIKCINNLLQQDSACVEAIKN